MTDPIEQRLQEIEAEQEWSRAAQRRKAKLCKALRRAVRTMQAVSDGGANSLHKYWIKESQADIARDLSGEEGA